MKKILFMVLILCSKMLCYGQSAQAMLDEIEGQWLPDENGEVTISKVVGIDSLKKLRSISTLILSTGNLLSTPKIKA
jgi:hypothetical protein